MKVMLAVASLMGAGHLMRMLTVARALSAAGAHPVIVTGGRPIGHLDHDGVDIVQLPPVWSDGLDYRTLLTGDGRATPAYLHRRAEALVAAYRAHAPDALVTELFPFGRRALSEEFLALLEVARPASRIYVSVRDVLEPKRKTRRWAETAARLRRWYDGVLVHGEAALTPLSLCWPPAPEFEAITRYTGYVAEPPPPPAAEGAGEVLVAVGGGAIGRDMLAAAVEAARGGARRWRLRVGGEDAAAFAAELNRRAAGAPVTAEPAAPDYRARLAVAACSVSLFGYNTATDLMQAGAPAVIVPMREGDEKEQTIRAAAFRGAPGFHLIDDHPTPETLRAAVEAAIAAPPPPRRRLDGAAETARLILSDGPARRQRPVSKIRM